MVVAHPTGAALIEAGLVDRTAGLVTIASLLVSIAAPGVRNAARGIRWALGTIVVLGAFGCSGGRDDTASITPPLAPVPPLAPEPPLDVSGWVTTFDGAIPLVLLAAHGGEISPATLPDRSCAGCVTLNDANTAALLYAISDAFQQRIGRRPYVVVNRLHRRKFDANRDRTEATGGHAPLNPMWDQWQARTDTAKARALRVHPRALLLDVHGHAHAVPRLELGYLLTSEQLRLTDALLGPLLASSSIARLDSVGRAGARGAPMLRGKLAFGTRLAALGYPAVPSAQDPAPDPGEEYFTGGFTTQRHGSFGGGAVDALQIECNYVGVRDTAATRAAFAEAMVTATLAYLADHYGWVPA